MNTFARKFVLTSFEKQPPIWWTELLKLWAPSGSQAKDGLRFAVRKNYCNFYIEGQSVGFINHDQQKRPRLSVHCKYVDEKATGNTHVEYGVDDAPDLAEIIARAKKKIHRDKEESQAREGHRDREKTVVDLLVGNNIDVIDLEMGLPASYLRWSSSRRIDLVSLERQDGKIRLVFWEAKLIDDARLRSRTDAEVLGQMADYKLFLGHAGDDIVKAYASACATLAAVHAAAKGLRPDIAPLSELLREVVANPSVLGIDSIPRLVVHGKAPTPEREAHLAKLAQDVPLLHLESEDDLKLRFVAARKPR